MFPPGMPGLALLLMRVSVALALLLTDLGHRLVLPGWVHVVAILTSVALFVGYLTPIAAATALGFHALVWAAIGVDSPAVTGIFALNAIALALLGPGAYSMDSSRFGRRRVLPPE